MIQNLQCVPQGLIESGTVNLTINTVTGLVDYTESITAGIGFLSETDANQGEVKIDPSLLLSASLKPGMTMTIGAVSVHILTASNGSGSASVVVNAPGKQLCGTISLDLTKPNFVITHVVLTGTVSGQNITLELISV